MIAWNAGVNGNFAAQDLIKEYHAAFFYNDVETALVKIEAYVRNEVCDESDEDAWCTYSYSLADFMWRHGILTDAVRNRAVEMIDSGFDLLPWEAAGDMILERRKKALGRLREKLLSPQPPQKKISLKWYRKPVFKTGDLVAIQLRTLDKRYLERSCFTEQFFRECNDNYVVLRKAADKIAYTSGAEPRASDHWAVFQLYGKVFDHCPSAEELNGVPWADPWKKYRNRPWFDSSCPVDGMFYCESNIAHFRKRKYAIIGKKLDDMPEVSLGLNACPYLGIDPADEEGDTDILTAIVDEKPR